MRSMVERLRRTQCQPLHQPSASAPSPYRGGSYSPMPRSPSPAVRGGVPSPTRRREA
jgi:hypothetical protein